MTYQSPPTATAITAIPHVCVVILLPTMAAQMLVSADVLEHRRFSNHNVFFFISLIYMLLYVIYMFKMHVWENYIFCDFKGCQWTLQNMYFRIGSLPSELSF